MTDLRKAAEMALEALEWNYGTDLENIENCTAWLDKMNATIPALRQALAQPAQNHIRDVTEMGSISTYKCEWVGLTEVEIYELMEFDDEFEFARAIEAKLKEKNNG